ncbi:hypothetical protein QJS04_geneDACA015977 [Acorus gramineus]|uniref:Uncharacterized protein n=1 Tax=Acorus gramineus TaxID=55184 RepID=A0AAV9BHU6_ACOGR|nr:hypothetical protein QJS04_geneDACA015977 [Acorus gramineus]
MEVASTASARPPTFVFRISQHHTQLALKRCSPTSWLCKRRSSLKCSINIPSWKQFGEPDKINAYRDKLIATFLETFPKPAREFPWKKAKHLIFERLLDNGKKTLKWSLIVLLVISTLSDIIFAISMKRELLLPVGLFVGCVTADLLKEISRELFISAKGEAHMQQLLCIGAFFVFVKYVSLYCATRGRAFFSHVGNGGLMQIIWLMKKLHEAENGEIEEQTSPQHLEPLPSNATN